jgi:caffeoyl-CoA O-methyltransferase
MELVRPRGLIILDKMLRGGRVLDPTDRATQAVDDLNKRIGNDPRVENVLLPVRDGICWCESSSESGLRVFQ